MPWTKTQIDSMGFDKISPTSPEARNISYRDAIREALAQALEDDDKVFIMGEGVDGPGGIFGTTVGLQERFGRERVFDLPLSENGFTGIAAGAAMAGMRPVLVHMRNDFMYLAMDQMANHAAFWRYMFGGKVNVPLTIRAIIGRGWGSAAQHSQSLQALFTHVPGLKVVMPSTPYDAKGLLLASIDDEDPVLVIEHRWLFEFKNPVPEDRYQIPIGKGIVRKWGSDVTVVAISYMGYEAVRAAEDLSDEGIDVEIVDPRSLTPLDEDTIFTSVKKTGRLVIADYGWKSCGVSAEIAARVAEGVFGDLVAPIVRVTLPDVPIPASPALEKVFYPGKDQIISAVRRVLTR